MGCNMGCNALQGGKTHIFADRSVPWFPRAERNRSLPSLITLCVSRMQLQAGASLGRLPVGVGGREGEQWLMPPACGPERDEAAVVQTVWGESARRTNRVSVTCLVDSKPPTCFDIGWRDPLSVNSSRSPLLPLDHTLLACPALGPGRALVESGVGCVRRPSRQASGRLGAGPHHSSRSPAGARARSFGAGAGPRSPAHLF